MTSFNADTVARVQLLDEQVVTGLLVDRTADLADEIPLAAAAGHSYVAAHKRLLRANPAQAVRLAAGYGLGIAAWTVDRPRALDRLRQAGVAAVIANDPGAALARYGAGAG